MCDRPAGLSRASFLAAAGAAAAAPAALAAAQMPPVPGGLSDGNARAAAIARASAFARSNYAKALSLAQSIGAAALRASVLDIIRIPSRVMRGGTRANRSDGNCAMHWRVRGSSPMAPRFGRYFRRAPTAPKPFSRFGARRAAIYNRITVIRAACLRRIV